MIPADSAADFTPCGPGPDEGSLQMNPASQDVSEIEESVLALVEPRECSTWTMLGSVKPHT